MDTVNSWSAPQPDEPIRAVVRLPGSKSITNRALVLAALADGPSTLTRRAAQPRHRPDDRRAARVGVRLTDGHGPTTLHVAPGPLHAATVDCGLAGTVMRFLPPVAGLAAGEVRFDGDEQARTRPLGTILDALRALGADIEGDAPAVRGARRRALPGGEVTIDASGSSQFVSGLLLSGGALRTGVTVRAQRGSGAVDAAYRDDHRDAAHRGRRGGRPPSRTAGRAAQPGPPGRLGYRARSVQCDTVPRRGRGHWWHGARCRCGRARPPSPATTSARSWPEWVPPSTATRR